MSQGPGVAAAGLETLGEPQRGREPPESRRDSHERLSRKTAPGFVLEAKPWTRSRCPGRAGSALCSVERPGSPGCPGGTARRGNKALRSQKATFTRGRTLGLCPTNPALIAAASGGARPSGAERGGLGREGGDGAGRERKGRAGRREAGRRLALAAASGGGSR